MYVSTQINIFGESYHLWIRGMKDKETDEYPDVLSLWNSEETFALAWYITKEKEPKAPNVAFIGGEVVLQDSSEPGNVFGYIWCSKEGMKGRSGYPHGLVGMRYGQETAKDSVFFDASSIEFSWRLAASRCVWNHIQWLSKKMAAPAPLALQAILSDKPELFKTKISKLSFREKMQRYLRKPTVKVYQAIVDEFGMFPLDRQEEIIEKLRNASVYEQDHINEIVEEFMAICQQCTSDQAHNKAEETLPAGL